ncbi:hypothetical protein N9V04_01800 [Bacteroidota bacterium]|nr:hypothetical protein [Bacteroidota bacterium]
MKEIFEKETQIKVLERLKAYTDFKYMRYVANTNEDYFIEELENTFCLCISIKYKPDQKNGYNRSKS